MPFFRPLLRELIWALQTGSLLSELSFSPPFTFVYKLIKLMLGCFPSGLGSLATAAESAV